MITVDDKKRAFATGFVANTDDTVDGGLVPVIIDTYDVCSECGTETDNGILHHSIGCINA